MTATRASVTPVSAFGSDVRVSGVVVVGLVVVGLGLISPGAVAG